MISSQSQNPYVYCMNNPLRYIDPSGMLMAEGGAYHEGYLQSYSGGYWIYYPESGGSCNVSGEGYREDHFAPSQPPTTPPANLPDCASYGGKYFRKSSYTPNSATYEGNRPSITKPGTTVDAMYYPENAFNGYEVDPCLWEAGFEINFVFISYSGSRTYNPHTNEWSPYEHAMNFGFTQVSIIGYAVNTPFDSFEERDAYYVNNGHLDIDVVNYVGVKGRHYEGYGWEGGLAVGLSYPGTGAIKAIDKILSAISIAGGGPI